VALLVALRVTLFDPLLAPAALSDFSTEAVVTDLPLFALAMRAE